MKKLVKNIYERLWKCQHMMRVRLYRKTGIAISYRWAKKIGGITIVETE